MSLLNSKELRLIFKMVDQNGDGRVSLDELTRLLESVHVRFTVKELESLVAKPDLDLDEFVSLYFSISERDETDDPAVLDGDMLKAFEVFDMNGDGYISSEELESVLRRLGLWVEENGGARDCGSMIRVYDTNSDGMLDFEEFKNMMLLDISS